MLALIAAHAKNRVIGQEGRIPWDIPADRRRFRDLTMNHVILMGRRTYEEIGRPLPGRETIVLSRTAQFAGCQMVRSLGEALRLAAGRDVFVCGGAALYQAALPLADVLYLTEIDREYAGDRYFPAFSGFALEQSEPGDGFTFQTWRRVELTWTQAREQIAELAKRRGIVPGLEPLRGLLHRLGDPQDCCPVVHIAGTNGKGSTLACIAAMLRQRYRVGTYSSPAVFEARECWQVDGEEITRAEYAHWITRIQAVCAQMEAEGEPTPTAFERETALAFLLFAQKKAEIAVIECGMGGAKDATNVVTTTAVSVLTSVGLEHMKFLGDTLAAIAREKGGICRPGVPAVLQGQSAEVETALTELCRKLGCPLTVVRGVKPLREDVQSVEFTYQGQQYAVSLPGTYQAINAAAAIEAVRQLRDFPLPEDEIRAGLRTVRWPGRFEQICVRPVIVIDGAHNPDAAERLYDAARRRWPEGGLVQLVGVLADKDFSRVGQILSPLAKRIITVTPENPRALPAQELADCLRPFCAAVTAADSVRQALTLAAEAAGADGAILAYGSLSWLGELRKAVEEML